LARQGRTTERLSVLPLLRYVDAGSGHDRRSLTDAGHGGQTKDLDGDEDDGYDEVIYPVDFRTAGHIVDDEMHRVMVASLQPGVRLTAIFDSCHSGSALDLPYIYSTQGVLKEPNLAKEAGQGLLGIVSSYAKKDFGGMLTSASGLFKKVTQGDDVYQRNLRTKTSPADVIMWSGSKDTQTSYVLHNFSLHGVWVEERVLTSE
jgi:metacaspase-1